jgi:surface antigen
VSRLLRAVATFASLLLVSGFVVAVTSTPASATSTLLCKGYAGCNKVNLSNAGYQAANGKMWWRMYSGHNCTNYVAYRLVQNGMPSARPWTGSGNANNWGHANAGLTDSVPAVGAVAWWDKYVRPAGSAGHVAYVEQVVSATEIVVSQDSWGGDFSWARITKAGGSWPSGFIHFNDAPLRNTAKPTVSGSPKVGATLTASTGAWTPSGVSYKYQWRADGVNIAKATRPTLKLTTAQQGKKIAIRLTAVKVGYPSAAASSARTPAVAPGELGNTSLPTISGASKVDSTLTASPGKWTPNPTSLAYQWSAGGSPISGATRSTLTPDASLVGKALSVRVTASKTSYDDVSVASSATDPVAPGTFTVPTAPTLTGTPRPGRRLALHPGEISPADADVSVQWLRSGKPVEDSAAKTYQLTAADLGSHLRARMTLTKPGYTSLTTTTGPTRLVRSLPRLKVRLARPGKAQMRFTVTVTPDGVRRVPGTVRITFRGKVVKELTLLRGTASTTLRGLPRGHRSFKIRYAGGPTVDAKSVWRTRWVS